MTEYDSVFFPRVETNRRSVGSESRNLIPSCVCHKWYRLTLTSTHLRPPITWMCRGRPRNCAATAPPLKKACTASRCAKCLQGGQPRNRKRCTIRRCKCACPRYINIDEATASQTPAIPAAAHCQVRPPNPATAHSAPLREGIRLASPSDATWIKARVTAWVKALNHLTKQGQCFFTSST